MPLSLPQRVTVISPHLDDGVFSCGCLLAACETARLVTVFAGFPPDGEAPDWDRAAGFHTRREAIASRRNEDRKAAQLLGAEPVWLDLLDSQYGQSPSAAQIAEHLRATLGHGGGTVVAPLGLFHSDHRLTHAACMLLFDSFRDRPRDPGDRTCPRWLFYEDAIYRRYPGVVQRRLANWWRAGRVATEVDLPLQPWRERKAEAVNAYASQLPLFNAWRREDLWAPERYWWLGTRWQTPHAA